MPLREHLLEGGSGYTWLPGREATEIAPHAVRDHTGAWHRGDLVVVCVDKHAAVMAELEGWSNQAQAGSAINPDTPAADPDYAGPAASDG